MSQQILNPGLDPTAYTTITGAQLAQITSQATFANSVGGAIVTTNNANGTPNVPNAVIDATLTTFLWIQLSNPAEGTQYGVVYFWNPNQGNPTNPTLYLNWNPVTAASIAPGSIQGYQIAPNTVPASALAGGITASQVIGLQNLLLNALTATSQPASGAVSGSFGSGFSLTAGSINSAALFRAGILNSYQLFSGSPILPSYIDTAVSNPAAGSVLMALNGNLSPGAWIAKAILQMAEPNNQAGYIPVVQSNGSVAWNSPTSAFPAGTITAAAEVFGTGSITVTAVSATTNTWTLSTAATGTLIASQTYITLSGYGTKYANLNGTWLVTTVTTNTSFVVVTSGNIAGSGTTTIGTSKFANYIGVSNLNVANTPTLVAGGTESVIWNSAGNYTINFVTTRGSTNYVVTAQCLDSGSTGELLVVKIKAKAATYVTIEVNSMSADGGGIILTPTDNADVSIIVL
jgi:hypothetical protein